MADQSLPMMRMAQYSDLPIPGTFVPVPPRPKSLDEAMRGISQELSQKAISGASSVVDALMAPGNALQGQYNQVEINPDGSVNPVNSDLISQAMNMAGTVGVGGSVVPRPVNSLGMGSFRTAAEIEDFAKSNGVSLSLSESPSKLTVGKIVVPASERNKGLGTAIMTAVTEYADSTGKPVTLTPSTDFGGKSVKALESFYSRLGFGKNSGRSKDFSFQDTMVRYPTGR